MNLFQKSGPILTLLFLIFRVTSAEKILFVHIIATYSHRVQTAPLAEELSKRGHNVHYITPFHPREKHPNITDMVAPSLVEFMDNIFNAEFDVMDRITRKMALLHTFIYDAAYTSCKILITSKEFQEWHQKNPRFDLVIVDNVYPECGVGLARILGAKSMLFSTVTNLPAESESVGFLPQSSSIPVLESFPLPTPMGFYDRVYNTYLSIVWKYKQYCDARRTTNLLREVFKAPDTPEIDELFRNISLVLSTDDNLSAYTRALPPLYVNVAGTHIKDKVNPLPDDVEKFINPKDGKDNDGFVYISLGTVAKAPNLPAFIRKVFMDTISSFPNVKFLWRWDGEFPKDIPKNLLLSKWFPQTDILGHPKLRTFVTQNGRPSTQEAIYHGVPMISFPILADQELNANRIQEMGGSLTLNIATVTVEQFRSALEKSIYDPTAKKRITQLQSIFRDRPMSPIDTAMWWIDYVLRHEDTAHLRPAGNDQSWLVRRQLDVWGFMVVLTLVGAAGIIAGVSKLLNVVRANNAKLKNA